MDEYVNLYDLLGVKKNATKEEIRKAYKKQIMYWHPDKNKSSNASEITAKLNEAKEILLDDDKRKKYDEELAGVKKKVYDNVSRSRKSNTSSRKSSRDEQKTYTKWQYFKLYLKHYNVPIWRKLLAIIFVLMETLICLLFEIINIIISYLIYYSYDVLYTVGIIVSIYFFIKGGINIAFNKEFNLNSTIFNFLIGFIVLIFTILLIKIYEITVCKMPIWISRLNMFLFKKAIGYK